jgi:hypothetical protein
MARRRNTKRPNIIQEMIGRIANNNNGFGAAMKSAMGLWRTTETVDYSRNDYDLYKGIYYASTVNGKGADYQLGAGFAKGILNSTAAFVIGNGFTVNIDGADTISYHQNAEEKINKWLQDNQGIIYDFDRFSYRDGDGFMLVGQDGELEMLDPDTVEIHYDPTSGKILGYDIIETVKTGLDSTTYIREYRNYSITFLRMTNGQKREDADVLYEVFSTVNGLVPMPTDSDGNRVGFFEGELVEMPLPVIHNANEPEPKAVYGNSDLQNVLIYFKQYHAVLAEAVKNNIYNSTPIPVISGVKNSKALEKASASRLGWGRDMVLYLEGDDSDAKFLTTNGTMEDTGKLLEYLFYLIVQASETPEFIFGTAVTSSKASTESQMPVMIKKTDRKRAQLKPALQKLVEAYAYSQMLMGDPDFYAVYNSKVDIDIAFPPIVDEDKKLTLDTIKMLLEKGIISEKTSIELSVIGDRVANIDEELEQAHKDADAASERDTLMPFDTNRVNNELNNGGAEDDELNADGTVGDN